MAGSSTTFRVFVSSTFKDLANERDALQEHVWPRLRQLCESRGARFQAIDLRWGVTDDASYDQRTMPICFEEIDRCLRTTTRPNFVILLADRYGWTPVPPEIPAVEFESIAARVSDEDAALLTAWFRRDDNAVPPVYVLQPRVDEYEDRTVWGVVENRLRTAITGAVTELDLPTLDRFKYEASATHQEIERGALRVTGDNSFGYFRQIEGQADEALVALKAELRDLLPGRVHDYNARSIDGAPSTDHIAQLCEDVYADLAASINAELEAREAVDPLSREILEHEEFGRARRAFFVGRTTELDAIIASVNDDHTDALGVIGPSGSGKSALLAAAAYQVRSAHPDAVVITRFVGATPDSTDVRSLLNGILGEVARAYAVEDAATPLDFRELVEAFPARLAVATATRPLVILIDALDQLSDADAGRGLLWLPLVLPQHVHLVVSTTDTDAQALTYRTATDPVIVSSFGPDDAAELLDRWLVAAGRALQPHQQAEVLARHEQVGLPLYLKLAFEEARLWRSYDAPSATVLAASVAGLIEDNLLARLEDKANHGKFFVTRALGLLAAAKEGLTEDELIEVLDSPEARADFSERNPRAPHAEHLPVIVWSRLYFDLAPYLSERTADGTSVLNFFHRQLAETIRTRYVSVARHRELAEYFASRRSDRALTELPFQQTSAEMWDEVTATLTDFDFLEAKAATAPTDVLGFDGATRRVYSGVYRLLEDFALAQGRMPGGDPSVIRRLPVYVTPVDFGNGYVMVCPHCRSRLTYEARFLGQTLSCPGDGCGEQIRISNFVTRRAAWLRA